MKYFLNHYHMIRILFNQTKDLAHRSQVIQRLQRQKQKQLMKIVVNQQTFKCKNDN
ncbi:hypothetical protein pb186bvf_002726 [Paramecium bursaria]